VVVSEYAFPMNYNRMPVHHAARSVFYREMQPRVRLREVTNITLRTPVWYAKEEYNVAQYDSQWGVPAFWRMKSGEYRFGWRIYWYDGGAGRAGAGAQRDSSNLVRNGSFEEGMSGWRGWPSASAASNAVRVVRMREPGSVDYAVRIENADGALAGIQQAVKVEAGKVYRLSATARAPQGRQSRGMFGGRLAVFLPPQPEHQIVWMGEYNQWWERELVFTNQVTGTAVVYAHLGYGRVATTGEFSSIRLERIERSPR